MLVDVPTRDEACALANAVERSTRILPNVMEGVQSWVVDVPLAGGKGAIVVDAWMLARRFSREHTSRERIRKAMGGTIGKRLTYRVLAGVGDAGFMGLQ